MSQRHDNPASAMIYLLLVLTVALWGGTWIAGRMIANHIGPMSSSFLRFSISALCLVFMVMRSEHGLPRLNLRQAMHAAFLGATGIFLYSYFFFTGLQTVPASRAALIVACIPVCIAVCSALIYREPFGPKRLLGTLLSLCGVAVVLSHGDPMALLKDGVHGGDLLILGCVAAWTAYSLGGRAAMRHFKPTVAVMWACVFGSAFLFFPALHYGLIADMAKASMQDWLCILFLSVLATVLGYAWYYKAINVIGPARSGIFINLVPVFAIIFACLMLGETPDISLLTGGCVVIAGVYVTNRG